MAFKYIESWKKYVPDYKIIEWNVNNFDVNSTKYTRFCYENRCFAFLSDYVRLFVVDNMGGIYFDTDVELIKSPDEFLKFAAYFGFENKSFVNTGIRFGSEAHHPVLHDMLYEYTIVQTCVQKRL